MSGWRGKLLLEDKRWKYRVLPVDNANFARTEHFVHHLAPRPRASQHKEKPTA